MLSSISKVSKKLAVTIAVDELVRERRFSDLRVDDICAAAGMSRSSFYRLFSDRDEIPMWCQDFCLRSGIREIGRTLYAREGHLVTCEGLFLFKSLFVAASEGMGPYALMTYTKSKHIAYMIETLEEYKKVQLDDELRFQIELAAEGQAAAVRRWLKGELSADVRLFAEWLTASTPQRLLSLIDEPIRHEPASGVSFTSFISASRFQG